MKFFIRLARNILAAALLMCATGTAAQTLEISPKPQNVEWGSDKAFDNTVSFRLTGEDSADEAAVALFKKHFSVADDGIEILIGERGDDAVAAYESLIPEASEGYYLNIASDKVIIAGHDASGTFYGVQTFIQAASLPEVMCLTVTDFPSVPERGLVEGYYGNPYSESDRMDLFEFFGRQKMNVYIYGPKDDAYHKSRWREPYPEEQGKKIAEYAAAAKANKVDFVWAIHPGSDIQWTNADSVNIVNKLKAMYELGIRTFAVFFDDISGEGTDAGKQAGLMNYISDELAKAYSDVNPLIICPTQYNKGWTSGNYLTTLGTQMNENVRIMWTGNSVVDMIGNDDMQWINNQISRKAYIWLNYPVTDYCINHLLMGPTYGNDLDIADMLSGFTSNPMEYAMASKVSLYSIGDYCWNMEGYDADASWESALEYLMPENREAFHFFCENNVDLGTTVHGLRRYNESPLFVETKELFDTKMAEGDTLAAATAMREHFTKFKSVADTLIATDEAPELIAEIMPWLQAMKYIGLRGECLMDMYAAIVNASPESFINSYLAYQEYSDAQDALSSRDFDGTLKSAKPEVATLYVAPYIKNTLAELVSLYKSLYDYRTDVFPAQEVEDGVYFIKYNGQYLTNTTPNVSGSIPQFVTDRDDVRPQRQEWRITLDPSTLRYKIVNMEDGRYLNENGEFTVSDATNPYEAIWHTYYIMRLADGKYCIQNAGSAGTKFWTVSGTRVAKSSNSTLLPSTFIFDLEPIDGSADTSVIEEGVSYYIIDGERYLSNVNVGDVGGTPAFVTVSNLGVAQEWVFAKDTDGGNHYKITSAADGRYVNEYGVFGTNAYYSDWNTYLILMMDGKFSIQTSQSAGEHFWNIVDNHIDWDGSLTRSTSYLFDIVKKGSQTGINDVRPNDVAVVDGAIVLPATAKKVTLYSVDGSLLCEARNCNRMAVEGLNGGVYLLTVVTDDSVSTIKIVLK